MDIYIRSEGGNFRPSELISGLRDAGLTKTADSWEKSIEAKTSINGTYESHEALVKAIGSAFSSDALRVHLLMATLEARSLDVDPDIITQLTVKVIND